MSDTKASSGRLSSRWLGMLPLPATTYGLRWSAVSAVLFRSSILRTLVASGRAGGIVVIGRGSRLRVMRGGKVDVPMGSYLLIGIEHNTRAGAGVLVRPGGTLRARGTAHIMRGCRVNVHDGATFELGQRSFINDGSTVTCASSIVIGSDCAISWGVTLTDTDVHRLRRGGHSQPNSAPIVVQDRCWVGTGATILKGVTLHAGSVVAAGSVVTRDVPPRSLVAGVPAAVLDDDVEWEH